MRTRAQVVIALLCLLLPAFAKADEAPVRAELMADTAAIEPGKPFTLGVLLHIAEGYHISWKNPGDDGLPTTLAWELPEGFAASQIRWPFPSQFDQPGGHVAYGYRNSVLLTAVVTPPRSIARETITVGAKVAWLASQRDRLPDKAAIELKLPVGKASSANAELFTRWEQRLPIPLGAKECPATATVNGALPPKTPGEYTVDLDWSAAPYAIECSPEVGNAVYVDQIRCRTAGNKTHITFRARRIPDQADDSLNLVIAWNDARGNRKAISVPIPSAASTSRPAE